VNAIATIAAQAAERDLPFLLGGGHAVITHGHSRNTFDLDLVIRRSDRERWTALARDMGYVPRSEGPNFVQFDAPGLDRLPLDLMLMNEETFGKLLAEAVPAPVSAGAARSVSLPHLLAMKCHAIKHGHAGRIVKDADDVQHLIQINHVVCVVPISGSCFLSTAQPICMKKSNDSAVEAAELEFPDWSGMRESAGRVTPDQAFQLCEEYAAVMPELAKRRRMEPPQKCVVEFTL